jgi:hypothetical protein
VRGNGQQQLHQAHNVVLFFTNRLDVDSRTSAAAESMSDAVEVFDHNGGRFIREADYLDLQQRYTNLKNIPGCRARHSAA